MKTSHAFWMFLPDGLEELFEMVRFERTDKAYDIWLDEKKKLSAEDYRNPDIVARGYTDYITIQDYPLRGAKTNGGTRVPTRYSVTPWNCPTWKAPDSVQSSWLF